MKKSILTLALTLVLLCAVVLAVPFAVSAESVSYDLTKGTYADKTIYSTSGDIVHYDSSGSIPGMSLGSNGSAIKLMGTPTETGRHGMDVTIYVRDAGEELTANVTIDVEVKSADVTLSTITKNYTVGDKVNLELNDFSTGGEIFDGSYSGELPTGVEIQFFDSYATLTGQVTKSGTYKVKIKAYDDFSEGWRYQSVVFNVTDPAEPPKPESGEQEDDKPEISEPKITKHPTGETVTVGERAVFIARADNADQIIWRLVSPDKGTTYECKDAPKHFDGLKVSGYNEEKLILSNIPLELNGWKAEAKFIGEGGTVWSKGALITVKKAPPKAPKITAQPVDTQMEEGSDVALTVKAESPQNKKLTYQWYRSTTDQNTDGEKISGATENVYHPEFHEVTYYYYCVVHCVEDDLKSEPATTQCAAVTCVQKAPETQAPTEEPVQSTVAPETTAQTEPVEQVPAVTAPATPEIEEDGMPVWALILIIVGAVAILIGGTVVVTLIIVGNKRGKYVDR